jgi:hypothetical protein
MDEPWRAFRLRQVSEFFNDFSMELAGHAARVLWPASARRSLAANGM